MGHNKRSCKGEVRGNSSLPTAASGGLNSRISRQKQVQYLFQFFQLFALGFNFLMLTWVYVFFCRQLMSQVEEWPSMSQIPIVQHPIQEGTHMEIQRRDRKGVSQVRLWMHQEMHLGIEKHWGLLTASHLCMGQWDKLLETEQYPFLCFLYLWTFLWKVVLNYVHFGSS